MLSECNKMGKFYIENKFLKLSTPIEAFSLRQSSATFLLWDLNQAQRSGSSPTHRLYTGGTLLQSLRLAPSKNSLFLNYQDLAITFFILIYLIAQSL